MSPVEQLLAPRHYVLVPTDSRKLAYTACGILPRELRGVRSGVNVTTLDSADVTCARCKAWLVDRELTRPPLVFVGEEEP